MSDTRLEALRAACTSPPEHPSPASTRAAGQQVMDAMLNDFLQLDQQGIGNTGSRADLERLLREPPPEFGCDLTQLLVEVRAKIVHHALRPNHPRFFAFIPGAPSFASILGECIASSTNLFAGVWKEAAGAAQVEIVVLDWFKQFLGYPAEASGLLTSGGSEANLTALVVARDRLADEDRGKAVLYASEHRHWSIDRAIKIIGMRLDQIRPLPCDAEFRLRIGAFEAAVAQDERAGRRPWLVLANAGTTNTGSVDPLAEIADVAAEHHLWLHVDAAYGWPMALTSEGKTLLRGIDRADSITLDPHKWFAQTFEAGCLLVRRGALLGQTFTLRPEYMQDVVPRADEINFCDHGIALTRRFRALKIWFSIKLLGIAWFRRLIEHSCALAEYAQALLERAGGFEIMSGRKLSVVCFRYVPRRWTAEQIDALQPALAEELRRSGRAFLSTTSLHERTALRLCFVNWRTTAADVEDVVAALKEIGQRIAYQP
jgi:aromatic-L-amino-acid/L-tryptophan decarboxylase